MRKPQLNRNALANPWAKVALAGVIELMILILWYSAVYSPMRSKASFLRSQRSLLDGKVEVASQAAVQIASAQSVVDSLQREIVGIHRKLFNPENLDDVVAKLARKAKVCGVAFESVEPDFEVLLEGGKESVVAPLPVRIWAVGTYLAFGKFLDDVQELPFYFEPKEVSVIYDPALYPRLKIELGATLYLKGKGHNGKEPSQGAPSSGQL